MSHKYLNDLGIKSSDICIFNTEETKDKRMKRFLKQRKKYGFDERETWSMDYTMGTWLYSHFKAYKKYANKIINLTFHKFDIPKWDKKETFSQETKQVTEEEAINIIIKNLKFYLKNYDCIDFKKEEKANMKFQYALRIIGIIHPTLWW